LIFLKNIFLNSYSSESLSNCFLLLFYAELDGYFKRLEVLLLRKDVVEIQELGREPVAKKN
jgi:hypothetical protein